MGPYLIPSRGMTHIRQSYDSLPDQTVSNASIVFWVTLQTYVVSWLVSSSYNKDNGLDPITFPVICNVPNMFGHSNDVVQQRCVLLLD